MIYLDNAATTPMYRECLSDFLRYAAEEFYNPSALYAPAMRAAEAVARSRAAIAKIIGASPENIIFTASGTESDNAALRSCVKRKKGRIIISETEHAAVYNTARYLETKGYTLETAKCDRFGRVDENAFRQMLGSDVALVSVMHVCNETGAVNDIAALSAYVKSAAPEAVFHSDGVQAFCKVPVNLRGTHVDLYSVSAHKIGGPKGIGALYTASSRINTFIFGGGQEKNIRSATENVAAISAFATAAELTSANSSDAYAKVRALSGRLISGLKNSFGQSVIINSDEEKGSPYIVNFAFSNVRGEVMLHSLERDGILVGTGSACSSAKASARIPKALGLGKGFDEGVLRVSFSSANTAEDVDFLLASLEKNYRLLSRFARI